MQHDRRIPHFTQQNECHERPGPRLSSEGVLWHHVSQVVLPASPLAKRDKKKLGYRYEALKSLLEHQVVQFQKWLATDQVKTEAGLERWAEELTQSDKAERLKGAVSILSLCRSEEGKIKSGWNLVWGGILFEHYCEQ